MSFITEAGQFSLTGNVGGAILPVLDNISILGSGTIVVTGDPILGTLTISGGGVTGMTEHAMVVGNAAGGITSLAVATNGQIPIGSTGNDVVLATLTAGNNIGISNAAGSITIKVNGLTNHTVQVGNGTGDLTSLAAALNGETLMGVTGADPSWTSSPQFGGSVTALYDITSTAGDLVSIGGSLIARDATNTSTGPDILLEKVRVAATIQSGDELGKIRFEGYDGTQYISGAKITSTNSGTVAATRIAGDLKFYTHPDSIIALPSEPLLRMTINPNGSIILSDAYSTAGTPSGTAKVTLVDSNGLIYGLAGTAGQILQGGNAPAFSTATYPSTVAKGDVLVASANNVIGVVNDVTNAGYVLTANVGAAPSFQALPSGVSFASDAETIAGTVTNKAVAPSNLKAKLGTQTIHALPIGTGDTNALGWLTVGSTGKYLRAATTADPAWSTLTLPDTVAKGDVLVASADNVVGVVNDVVNAGYVLTANVGAAPSFQALPSGVSFASDAETIAGTVTNKAVAPSNLKAKLGTQTIHALPIGTGDTNALGWLTVGSTGKYLRAATTADPAWSTLTLPDTVAKGDVLVASADNVVGVVNDVVNAGYVLTANSAAAPTFQAVPTYTLPADVPEGFVTDSGTATPSTHSLTVSGGTNIGTTGAGATLTINLDSAITLTSVNATTFDTNVVAAGVTLAGTTLSADGTDADININITAKGTGKVIIDDLQLTTDLAVTEGGTGVSTITQNGVIYGNATSAIGVTSEGATGTVLVGTTSAAPSFSASPTVTTMYATTFDTNVAAAGVTLSGTTLAADGTDTDINLTLTPKGTGVVSTTKNINAAGISFDSGTTTLANYVTLTSFTPSISFSGGTTGITYSTQEGYYSRIGNIIFFRLKVILTSNGSSTGYVRVEGLPVNAATDCYGFSTLSHVTYTGDSVQWRISSGKNYLALIAGNQASGAYTTLNESNIEDDADIYISGFYFV